jgi:hypothetical protein
MMQSVHRYRALGAADQSLVLEAAMLLVVGRLGLVALQFSVLRRALGRGVRMIGTSGSQTSAVPASRIGWAIAAVARRLPFRSTCLLESLAADAMLRRRGYASEIRFGVRPPSGGVLAAHAWVEHEGAVVFGAMHELSEYSPLATRDTK